MAFAYLRYLRRQLLRRQHRQRRQLDRRETKEDHNAPCTVQVTAPREVAMRVPTLVVAPTPPLFPCVLRTQSRNASFTGPMTDLSNATVAAAKVASTNTGPLQVLRRWTQALSDGVCLPFVTTMARPRLPYDVQFTHPMTRRYYSVEALHECSERCRT